jgi:2-C-methyl-D-erythritol 4-phosphate cytidylyltransferase
MECGIILVGAGEGVRFGRPKAFVELGGRRLLDWCAAAFDAIPHRVAVLRSEDQDDAGLPGWTLAPGGARRRDSVANGLAALDPQVGVVLIHDVARPLVSAAVIQRVIDAAPRNPAVIPVIPVRDTIKRVRDNRVLETLPREELAAAQTPQAFHRDLLERALAATAADATDEGGLVEALGEIVHTVPGDVRNAKITHPDDLRMADALL